MKKNELTNLIITGDWKDIIRKDGRIVDTIDGHNIVVNSALNLMAALIGNKIQNNLYWAIGSGNADWDNTPVDPMLTDTQLENEIGRKLLVDSNIEFYDNVNKVSQTPTNRIHIMTMFEEQECNGDWREFGIFGGDANVTINSGIMIDHKHHGIITKDSNTTIERHLILTFRLGKQIDENTGGVTNPDTTQGA